MKEYVIKSIKNFASIVIVHMNALMFAGVY